MNSTVQYHINNTVLCNQIMKTRSYLFYQKEKI